MLLINFRSTRAFKVLFCCAWKIQHLRHLDNVDSSCISLTIDYIFIMISYSKYTKKENKMQKKKDTITCAQTIHQQLNIAVREAV